MNKTLVVLIFLSATLLWGCQQDKDVVAWVDDAPITTAEMDYWMLLKKAEVHRYFYMEYGVNDSDDFWQSSFGGESPLEMLKSLALEEAKRCKVQQLLAFERGLIKEINFDLIISKIAEENKTREEKVKRGEVIYGPKKFTVRTYFSYQHDKMVHELKQELVKEELQPTREELDELKPNEEISVDEYEGFLKMQYVDKNYDAFIDNLTIATTVKLNKSVWKIIKI